MIEWAGLMIFDLHTRKLVMQKRDDDPEIENPEKICFFGGGIEEGETPVDCCIRELNEELGLKMLADAVELFFVMDKIAAIDGRDCRMHLFRSLFPFYYDPERDKAEEGEIILLSLNEVLSHPDTTSFSKCAVTRFLIWIDSFKPTKFKSPSQGLSSTPVCFDAGTTQIVCLNDRPVSIHFEDLDFEKLIDEETGQVVLEIGPVRLKIMCNQGQIFISDRSI